MTNKNTSSKDTHPPGERRQISDLFKQVIEHIDLDLVNKTLKEDPNKENFNDDDYDTVLYLNLLRFIKRAESDHYQIQRHEWVWFGQVIKYFNVPLEKVFTPQYNAIIQEALPIAQTLVDRKNDGSTNITPGQQSNRELFDKKPSVYEDQSKIPDGDKKLADKAKLDWQKELLSKRR